MWNSLFKSEFLALYDRVYQRYFSVRPADSTVEAAPTRVAWPIVILAIALGCVLIVGMAKSIWAEEGHQMVADIRRAGRRV